MQLSRRKFLGLVGLGAAGVVGARGFPGFTPLARAQETEFPTPPVIGERLETHRVVFRLVADEGQVNVAGRSARLLTYNGHYPGPTLRMREGDDVQVRFTNNLGDATNLHFHGLHISPTGSGDNIFRHVQPGETATYEFTVPAGSAGTYWYHPHVHGSVAPQLFRGLAGAIIVESALDTAFMELPEQLLVLKDFEFRANGVVDSHTMMDWAMGREGSLLTINGEERPTLGVSEGAVRLRLLNAANARFFRLGVPEATLTVIATDGGFVTAPFPVEDLLLAPGERFEVVAQFPRRGGFELIALPYERAPEEMAPMSGMSAMRGHNMGAEDSREETMRTGVVGPTPLMHFEVGSPGRYRLPLQLASITALSPESALTRRRIVLSENMTAAEFYIDGKRFDAARTDFAPALGAVEHWEIVNESGMDHPMHLHVHPFQVYRRNGEREPVVAWKDVVNVPAQGSVELLVPFRDFAGKTVFHCHVVEHEDRGMMSTVDVQTS